MKILTLPNPILIKKSDPIDKVDNKIKKLMDKMLDTMYKAPGIGLAAPQVGINKRVIVMDASPRPGLKRYQEEKIGKKEEIKPNPIQMANPELIWVSEKKEKDEEGCLSIPGFMGEVTRPSSCKVKYLDRNGESKELLTKGLLARCVQHEIDHVNGVLFIDYLSSTKKDIILRKIKKQQKEKEQTT
tara:strand:- start:195 stop:752 length:558 start_codon:yes stop_codon:yes gene_type:complete